LKNYEIIVFYTVFAPQPKLMIEIISQKYLLRIKLSLCFSNH